MIAKDLRLPSDMSDMKRMEKADLFLKYALERLAPGGYLAMIMPNFFLLLRSSPEIRKQLLTECDLLELWELNEKVFPQPKAVVVLFAQKKFDSSLISRNPVKVRNVQANTLSRFEDSGVFTASGIVADQTGWNAEKRKSKGSKNTHLMDYSLILSETSWEAMKSCCRALESSVTIFQGAIQGKYAKPSASPRKISFLPRAKGILLPDFQIAYDQAIPKLYPNEFIWPRLDNEALFVGNKALFASIANPSWGKRTKVAIERRGYYVSDNFFVLAPKKEAKITIEVITAVVDWYVSNAWIIEHLKHPKIVIRAVRTIPFQ